LSQQHQAIVVLRRRAQLGILGRLGQILVRAGVVAAPIARQAEEQRRDEAIARLLVRPAQPALGHVVLSAVEIQHAEVERRTRQVRPLT
jgi:hypothetical protein